MSGSSFTAALVQLFATPDPNTFLTRPVNTLTLTLEGIPGDRHHGFTRPAGPREPWYKKGTPIRSGRMLSIVSVEELAEIAGRMEIPRIDPAWIGANIVIAGAPDFSALPWGTRLFCADAVLVNEGDNAPCRFAGAAIAAAYPGRHGLDLAFVKHAKNRRGIVATVERAGAIETGPVRLKLPAQKKPWTGGTLL